MINKIKVLREVFSEETGIKIDISNSEWESYALWLEKNIADSNIISKEIQKANTTLKRKIDDFKKIIKEL